MTAPWVVPVRRNALTIPEFKAVAVGRWRIRRAMQWANMGFWGDDAGACDVAFLEGPGEGGGATANWMSTVQLELDSQEIGIAGAVGTTVVFGFGLGWATVNAALNPAVERVIAVERDPEIIALSEVSGVFDGLSPEVRGKIEIRQGDAFDFAPERSVDTMLADIWPDWLDPAVCRDVVRLQHRVGAARVHFWGQEATIWRAAVARFGPTAPFDWPAIRATVAEDLGLPLILPDWPDYPEMILRCVQRAAPAEVAAAAG